MYARVHILGDLAHTTGLSSSNIFTVNTACSAMLRAWAASVPRDVRGLQPHAEGPHVANTVIEAVKQERITVKKAFFTIALILAAIAAFIPPRGSRASAHTALAAPVVIDFENVAVGPLTNQYASLGITFNNPTVRSYQHLPGFAHSGVKGIEQCFAAEFCNAPIDISFTSGQRHVKVWVGYADPLSTSQTVLLRALDANGVQLGQATTVFAPSTVVRPVNTPVEITLPNANIRRALVSFSPTDIPISSLVMDDLEFDSAGQPPECPATQNPTLTMQQPLDNQIVQFDVFTLGATVTSQDPLATSMTLTVNGPGGATNSQQLPLASGNFGPMSMNGFLFPGLNTITLTFQDCRGTAQVSRTITYNPIPAGTRFGLLGIEVTQATQDTGNSVPLVANKPAMARVFLRIQSPAGPSAVINDVFGKLSAQRRVGGGLGDFLPPGEY